MSLVKPNSLWLFSQSQETLTKKKKRKHNRSKLLPNSRAVKTTARLQEVLVSLSISYLKNLAPDILASHSA